MSQRNFRIRKIATSKKDMSNINNEYCNRYVSDGAVEEAIYQAQQEHDHFMQLILQQATSMDLVLSTNDALEYATTGSALIDFNARATEFRNADESVIIDAAVRAYAGA